MWKSGCLCFEILHRAGLDFWICSTAGKKHEIVERILVQYFLLGLFQVFIISFFSGLIITFKDSHHSNFFPFGFIGLWDIK